MDGDKKLHCPCGCLLEAPQKIVNYRIGRIGEYGSVRHGDQVRVAGTGEILIFLAFAEHLTWGRSWIEARDTDNRVHRLQPGSLENPVSGNLLTAR